MNTYMQKAINLAVENVKNGGQPFGAVLVRDDVIVGEGVNELHISYDVSGHAELLAVRRAQEKLQTNDLSDCTMYASGKPCPMCLGAMYFAGIKTIYYSQTLEDAKKVGLGRSGEIYADIKKPIAKREMRIVHMPLQDGIEDPMKIWGDME